MHPRFPEPWEDRIPNLVFDVGESKIDSELRKRNIVAAVL
jgi:hypothetical protein